jgi:Spy/CpxP family protein refolding chaperone
MYRFTPWRVLILLVIVCIPLGMPAAEEPSQRTGEATGPAAGPAEAARVLLPGFLELPAEDVQEELGLTGEQREKLGAIGREFYEQVRRDWAESRSIPTEERRKGRELTRKQRMTEIRRQIEEVLTPEQVERLKQINLRARQAAALADAAVLDELDLSEAQERMLLQIRDQMEQKTRRIEQESFEKTLEVLTPQQRSRLGELTSGGFGT